MEAEAWPLSVIVYVYVGGYGIAALVCLVYTVCSLYV